MPSAISRRQGLGRAIMSTVLAITLLFCAVQMWSHEPVRGVPHLLAESQFGDVDDGGGSNIRRESQRLAAIYFTDDNRGGSSSGSSDRIGTADSGSGSSSTFSTTESEPRVPLTGAVFFLGL